MSIGPDLKEVLSDVGTAYKIIRDSGDITGEYLDFEMNAQVTKPFIKEFFLDAVLAYDTVAVLGDIIEFTASNERYLIMNKTPEMFENQVISYGVVLYKTNVLVTILRPSEPTWRRYDYRQITTWTSIKTIDALLTTPLFGNFLDTDEELGLIGMEKGELYLPSSVGIIDLDRVWIDATEYYRVESVKRRRYPGVDVVDVGNDTRPLTETTTSTTTTTTTSPP